MQLIGGLTLYRHLKKTIDIVQLIVFYEKKMRRRMNLRLIMQFYVCVCLYVY